MIVGFHVGSNESIWKLWLFILEPFSPQLSRCQLLLFACLIEHKHTVSRRLSAMGAAASINKEFANEMKNKGFKSLILDAKSDADKVKVFDMLRDEVRRYFAAEKIQAVARTKIAQKQALSGGSLHEIFLKFCRFGKGQSTTTEMDGKRWAKFCKENKFYTINKKAYNATGADMVFAKVSETSPICFSQQVTTLFSRSEFSMMCSSVSFFSLVCGRCAARQSS